MELLKNILKSIWGFVMDLLFPIECLGCGREKVWLCDECLSVIPLNRNFVCPTCGKKSANGQTCPNCQSKSYLDGLLSASFYKNKLLRDALHALKYKYATDLAKPLGRILGEYLRRLPAARLNELLACALVPVPLHRRKLLERGFNQSELLAREIAEVFNWKINTEILIRQKRTSPQVNKKKTEKRKENVADAFAVPKRASCPRRQDLPNRQAAAIPEKIILIDDVTTSGATLQEAAKALKAAGAKEVWGLTLAKG